MVVLCAPHNFPIKRIGGHSIALPNDAMNPVVSGSMSITFMPYGVALPICDLEMLTTAACIGTIVPAYADTSEGLLGKIGSPSKEK